MLDVMHEDLAQLIHGIWPRRRRLRLLRQFRREIVARLADNHLERTALQAELALIDSALSDYMLGGKQGSGQ